MGMFDDLIPKAPPRQGDVRQPGMRPLPPALVEQGNAALAAGPLSPPPAPTGGMFDDLIPKAPQTSFLGNAARGAAARGSDLLGGLIDTGVGIAESLPDWMQGGVVYDDQGLRVVTGDEYRQTPSVVGELAKTLRGHTAGYEPRATWENVKQADGILDTMKQAGLFAAEQGIVSLPDMFAAATPGALPTYMTMRTGELARDRATAHGREEISGTDLSMAAPTAAAVAALERFGAQGLLRPSTAGLGLGKGAAVGFAEGGLKEGLTEAMQNPLEYMATTPYGKLESSEAIDQALAGAVAGAGYGGPVGAVTGAVEGTRPAPYKPGSTAQQRLDIASAIDALRPAYDGAQAPQAPQAPLALPPPTRGPVSVDSQGNAITEQQRAAVEEQARRLEAVGDTEGALRLRQQTFAPQMAPQPVDLGIEAQALPTQDIEAAPPPDRQPTVEEALLDLVARMQAAQQRPPANIDVEQQQLPVQNVEAAPAPPERAQEPFPPAPPPDGIQVERQRVQDIEAARPPLEMDVEQIPNIEAAPAPTTPVQAALDELTAQMRPARPTAEGIEVENIQPTEVKAARAPRQWQPPKQPKGNIDVAFEPTADVEAAPAPGEPRLSRAVGGQQNRRGADPTKLQTAFDGLTSTLKGAARVRVVPTQSALPAAVRQKIAEENAEGVDGVFYEGEVWMVADALPSPERAAQVYFHETVGHHGLRGLFNVSDSPEGMKAFDKLLDDVIAAYRAGKFDEWFKGDDRQYLDLHLDQFPTEHEAAEEFFARLSERGAKDPSGLMQRLRVMVAQALRRVPGLGRYFQNITKAEVDEIVARARRYVEQGGKETAEFRGSRFARNLPGDVRFSRGVPDFKRVVEALKGMAEDSRLFTNPKYTGKRLDDAIGMMNPGLVVQKIALPQNFYNNGYDNAWEISSATTGTATVELMKPKGGQRQEVYIDIENFDPGERGEHVYQAVADWAHNNGYHFIGDPRGLSAIAQIRRTEQMISSALKWGTTRHLGVHAKQRNPTVKGVAGIKTWHDGRTLTPEQEIENLAALVEASHATLTTLVPEAGALRYNFDTARLEKADGSEATDRDLEAVVRAARGRPLQGATGPAVPAGHPDAKATPVGARTIKRLVLTSSLLEQAAGDGWGQTLARVSGRRSTESHPTFRKAFLSRKLGRGMGAGERPTDRGGLSNADLPTEGAGTEDRGRAAGRAEARGLPERGGVRGGARALADARRSDTRAGRPRPLEGLPTPIDVNGRRVEFGPFAPAHEAARRYAEKAGIPYRPLRTYAKVDPERARRIADAYAQMPHAPSDPAVKRAYAAMIRETIAQYREVLATGLKIEFIPAGEKDPYGNPRNAIIDVVENNHLWVFSTRDGFGTDAQFDPSENPLLAETEFEISGQTALANDLFRVVHDYFGHIKDGVGFRAEGEENAWRSHSTMYSPLARRAMTTETRGQNSWLNFGPHGEKNRTAKSEDTTYADQKTGLLPEWVSSDGARDRGPRLSRRLQEVGFYSGVQKAVDEAKMNVGQPVQWMNYLRNQPGVKPEELDWLDLESFFKREAERGNTKIKRDELSAYIAANTIEIVEIGHDADGPQTSQYDDWRDQLGVNTGEWTIAEADESEIEAYVDAFLDEVIDEYGDSYSEETLRGIARNRAQSAIMNDESRERVMEFDFSAGPQDFSGIASIQDGDLNIWIEGEPVYEGRAHNFNRGLLRELAIQYVDSSGIAPDLETPGEEAEYGDGVTKWSSYQLDSGRGGTDYREIVFTLPEEKNPAIEGQSAYRKPIHWDYENPLAHARFADYTSKDGEKVLLVEELQSDWHHDGSLQGYRKRPNDPESAQGQLKAFRERMKEKYGPEMNGISSEEMSELRDLKDAAFDERFKPGVPWAPMKTSWPMLIFKRMLRLAVEEGHDLLAWTTGTQQNYRYGISRQVSRIEYARNADGTFDWAAVSPSGEQKEFTNMPIDEVVSYVGADLARRMEEGGGQENDHSSDVRRYRLPNMLTGLDLEVGGEGKKNLYDRQFVNEMNKYLKKWGARVERVELNKAPPKVFLAELTEQVRERIEALGLPSPPADKQYVMQFNVGEPMYFDSMQEAKAEGEKMRATFDKDRPGIQHAVRITDKMREGVKQGQPLFSRKIQRTSNNPITNLSDTWRARVGDPAWEKLVATVKPMLAAVKFADTVPDEFRKQMREFRAEVQREGRKIQGVAERSAVLAPQERVLISDFIERTLKPGVIPPTEIGSIAAAMRAALADQRDELIRMKMLSEDTRERWGDEYIARYYAKHVVDKPWDKVLRAAHKAIDGSHLRGRGLFEVVARDKVDKWKKLGWEARFDDGGPNVTMWRDFTPEERAKMGEIRDGVYRFVRGYLESAKDIAMGHLFEKMAASPYARSDDPGDGNHVQVPLTTIGKVSEGMKWKQKRNPGGQFVPDRAYRYGKLAGKWIPRDIWEQLAPMWEPRHPLADAYLKALALWKEGKTVLNPVVHSNNIVSNVIASYWAIGSAGLSPEAYSATWNDYRSKGKYYQEAIANGLFGTEYYSAEIAALMPQLPDGNLNTAAAGKVSKLLAYIGEKTKLPEARKALQRAYEAEDQFFKLLLYRHMREAGIGEQDAIDFAERYVFNYADVPKGVRVAKATGWPFASYTYKAIPMVARTLLQHPERLAATFALFGGVNWLSFTLLGDAGDEDEERKVMPEYMRGRTAVGAPKNIRMPFNMDSGAAAYMDISRRIPLGDLFDMNNQAGGLALPAPLMPNNPLFTLAVGVLANKDMFTGDEIVPEYDQDFALDKHQALAAYFARQMMPNNPAIPGSYSWNKVMNGLAGSLDTEIGPYTGEDYRGRTQSFPRAVLDTMLGIKIREVDVDTERQKRISNQARLARDIKTDIRGVARDKGKTDAQREAEIKRLQQKLERVMDKAMEYNE